VVLVNDDEALDQVLGRVARRRENPEGWGFTIVAHQDPAADGSRLYCSQSAAAQACAIAAIDGTRARCEFDAGEPLPAPMPPRTSPTVSGTADNERNEPGM
jgi:hypothetical protein